MISEPTVQELIAIGTAAIQGKDKVADDSRGSDYEAVIGPNAILWSRSARRDTDMFKAGRFTDATGDELTDLVFRRYGIDRTAGTRGTGTAIVQRPTAAAGSGHFWKGSRIQLSGGPFGEPRFFRVLEDTASTGSDLLVTIPIEANKVGSGTAAQASSGLTFDDPTWDPTWTVASLSCASGTDLESATEFQNRVRLERSAARVGQEQGIIDACKKAGASQVALFRSNYGGVSADGGLNFVYVGDSGYSGTPTLVRQCVIALRSVRVAGDHLQVGALVRTSPTINVDIYLSDSPQVLPLSRIEYANRRALVQYFEGSNGKFTYTLSGIEASLARSAPEVQEVDFVLPASDASVLVSGSFPATLNRYFADDRKIFIRYHPPK